MEFNEFGVGHFGYKRHPREFMISRAWISFQCYVIMCVSVKMVFYFLCIYSFILHPDAVAMDF